jgi:16S rRNA processing protein RimM
MSGSRPTGSTRYLTLGQVAAAHGVRGGLKVNAFTDPPEALLEQVEWHLVSASGQERDVRLRSGAAYRGQLRVELEGIDDRDAAQALSGWWIQIDRARLPPPAEREHFREDLLGLSVVNGEGATLGTLSHFVDLPAGTVMVVRGAREHWIPAAPPHLRRVDRSAGAVHVDWPEEL